MTTEKVGINTLSPAEALDVSGSIQTSNNLIIQGTTDSASIGTGAVKYLAVLELLKNFG